MIVSARVERESDLYGAIAQLPPRQRQIVRRALLRRTQRCASWSTPMRDLAAARLAAPPARAQAPARDAGGARDEGRDRARTRRSTAALASLPPRLAAAPRGRAHRLPASLPRDHPAWQRDVLAVSARVRARHRAAAAGRVRVADVLGSRRAERDASAGAAIEVDPSGCYRMR